LYQNHPGRAWGRGPHSVAPKRNFRLTPLFVTLISVFAFVIVGTVIYAVVNSSVTVNDNAEFTVSSISPSSGSTSGGNAIVINGENFPYAGTDMYEQDGLVLHLDAIDNAGLGDRQHVSAPNRWVDVTGNLNDCALSGSYTWTSNMVYGTNINFTGTCATPKVNITNDYTVEIALRSSKIQGHENIYTSNYITASRNWCQKGTNYPCSDSDSSSIRMYFTFSNTPITGSMGENILGTAATTRNNTFSKSFVNGVLAAGDTRGTLETTLKNNINLKIGPQNTSSGSTVLRYHSFRIYNKALTDEQIAHNATLDQMRFIAPPTVAFGSKSCTNVIVLSATQLQCTAPNGSVGKVNVTVTPTDGEPLTITDGYEYADSEAMTVISVSPTVGPSFGGPYIKITGNNLDIASVTLLGETCEPTSVGVTNNSSQYYCILPAVDIDESRFVDVIVTGTEGDVYTLYKSFEYVKVDKGPISANVQ
jgi:hypothetical protein